MIDNEWGFSQYPLLPDMRSSEMAAAPAAQGAVIRLKVGQRVESAGRRAAADTAMPVSAAIKLTAEGAVPTILNRGGFAEKFRAGWQWVILFRRI